LEPGEVEEIEVIAQFVPGPELGRDDDDGVLMGFHELGAASRDRGRVGSVERGPGPARLVLGGRLSWQEGGGENKGKKCDKTGFPPAFASFNVLHRCSFPILRRGQVYAIPVVSQRKGTRTASREAEHVPIKVTP
jgi:hypothetical protein